MSEIQYLTEYDATVVAAPTVPTVGTTVTEPDEQIETLVVDANGIPAAKSWLLWSSDCSIELNTHSMVDVTASEINVVVPLADATAGVPFAGNFFEVLDIAGNSATNHIYIHFPENNLLGSNSTFILNTDGGSVVFSYVDETYGWIFQKN